jgi:hypothetical protein
MELKDLSKIKYIYKIYESVDNVDNVLHLEKYPVIYINSEMLYFKVHGSKMLHSIYLSSILDSYTEYKKHFWSKFFFGISTDINDIFEDLKKQQSKYKLKQEKDKYEKALNELKKLYEQSIKQLDTVKKLREEVDKINNDEVDAEIEKYGKLFDEIQRCLQSKSEY